MNPYIEQNILNADPVELIRILYRHGIASLRDAREHIRGGRSLPAAQAMLRAADVIAELNRSLRPEAAPDIAAKLRGLYAYMHIRVFEAAAKQNDEPLAEVLGLMTTLSEAWQFNHAPAPSAGVPAGLAWQAAMAGEAAAERFEIHA